MVDSRLAQWSAVLDDVRCEMADMADEGVVSDLLGAARSHVNHAISYITLIENELGDRHGV